MTHAVFTSIGVRPEEFAMGLGNRQNSSSAACAKQTMLLSQIGGASISAGLLGMEQISARCI